jgi:predicted DCC family thiol-disulfide oxidoreductase YuxK
LYLRRDMDHRSIIIFDGLCNFCNGAVNFIIKRDPKKVFVFTPMQSSTAKELMKRYQITTVGIDTVVLIKNGVYSVRSKAVLEIAKDLTGFWHFSRVLLILPVSVRDCCYRLFARYRYKLFGKQDSRMAPTAEIRDRFIE